MSKAKDQKKSVIADIKQELEGAQSIVLAKYHTVTAEGMNSLRVSARKSDVFVRVVKNTLARIAFNETKFKELSSSMSGPLVYVIAKDGLAPSKVVSGFIKENPQMEIVAGMLEDKLLNPSDIERLASIPPRDQLLSILLGTMLQVPASFARAIAAIAEKKAAA